MARTSEARAVRYGAVTLVIAAIIVAATFNLNKFPGFGGTSYVAMFTDASGIRTGNIVQIGGIRVGRVQEVSLDGPQVAVTFEVDDGVDFGPDSSAAVRVLNLLGEKYLELVPAGDGQLDPDTPIPVERTEAAYDIVGVFSDLTTTTEQLDKEQLKKAFDVLSDTADAAAPEIQRSFDGIARLSRSVASRDAELRALFASSREVTTVLQERADDLVDLMDDAGQVFRELQRRRVAVHDLLVNAQTLARELRGVARDNQAQIGPALAEVSRVTRLLTSKEKEIKTSLSRLGPYAGILGNIIGTGPWFDAYIVNLYNVFTGEFQPIRDED